jgi:hypothetical protein
MLPPISSGVVAQIGDLEKGLGDIGRSRRGQRLASRHDRGVVERVIAIAACQVKEEFNGKSGRPGRGRQPEFRRICWALIWNDPPTSELPHVSARLREFSDPARSIDIRLKLR